MSSRRLADRLIARAASAQARRVLNQFLHAAHQATAVQGRVLFEKIRRNAASDYGRDHDFAGIRTYQDFRRQVPVTTYEDLTPYIERVKAGDLRAMFGGAMASWMTAAIVGLLV